MSNPVKDRRDNVVMTNKDDVWKYRRVSWQTCAAVTRSLMRIPEHEYPTMRWKRFSAQS